MFEHRLKIITCLMSSRKMIFDKNFLTDLPLPKTLPEPDLVPRSHLCPPSVIAVKVSGLFVPPKMLLRVLTIILDTTKSRFNYQTILKKLFRLGTGNTRSSTQKNSTLFSYVYEFTSKILLCMPHLIKYVANLVYSYSHFIIPMPYSILYSIKTKI